MKLPSISSHINNRRGAIGTVAVLIGMVVVGLGILLGSQIRNQNINLSPRAATPTADPLWSGVKPAPGNIYPWTNGPTTGWESYLGQRVYICKGEWCWTIDRSNNQTVLTNNGSPFQMSQDPAYKNSIKPSGGRYPWTDGPTAAWTWDIPYNGQTVNETLICNRSLCWRYIRYANGSGEWRDGGNPINLASLGFWKDKPGLYTNNGPTVGWTDPINKKATLCNGSYCESLSYASWTWLGQVSPFPPGKGVSQYTSAWTSPVTNIQTLCTLNSCWQFTLRQGGGTWSSEAILIAAPTSTIRPTNTPVPPTNTPRPTNTPQPTVTSRPTSTPQPTVTSRPTNTPQPTVTPRPTNTTAPTITSRPTNTTAPTVTKLPTVTSGPTNTPMPQCPKRAQGDADCNGTVDYVDFVCWRGELIGSKPSNCISSDFDGSGGKPSSADYNIWRKTFIDPLNK